MEALQKTLEITNDKGLHVRAATVLAQAASRFKSEITVEHAGERANGKSVMNLLLLTAAKGTQIRVRVQGDDAPEAMAEITRIVEMGFYEQ